MSLPASVLRLAILVLFLHCLTGRLQADDSETPAAPIAFQVVPEQESFQAEQGVWLTVIATNSSADPQTFVWGDYPYDDLFEFEIVRPDGAVLPPPRHRLCPIVEGLSDRDVVTLAPGESCQRTIVLGMMYGANVQTFRFVFPGEHLVRSRMTLLPITASPDDASGNRQMGSPLVIECDEIKVLVEGEFPDPTLHYSMTGRVVDSQGEPVPQVQIEVEAQREGFASIDGLYWERIDRVVTDADGEYAVEGLDRSAARHRLVFHHPEHPLQAQEFPTRSNEGIIENDPVVLADGHTIEGLVTDADGTPIAGVRVSPAVGRECWTNSEGRFLVTGIASPIEELTSLVSLQSWKRGWVESGAPNIVEIDGELVLHQIVVPEAEHQVAGVARFSDGDPAAGLDLYVYRDPSDGYPVESTTDAQGRFTIDWSQLAGQSDRGVAVVLEKGERHLPRRAWVTTFKDLDPGRPEVELVFERTRRLELDVFPSNELPASATLTVNVSVKAAGNRVQLLLEEHLPATGGSLTWDRLSPGSYVINVRVDHAEHWNWSQDVEIAADGGSTAECRFDLPELLFGDATIQVVTSDGQPWGSGDLWMDSSNGWGPVPVRNGIATLSDVPAGPVHVEVHTEGYARTHLRGEIVADETVDLGTLQALTLEEGTGLVIGRVLLPGGGPAVGARVEVQGGSYGRAPHMGGAAVDGDGLFEIRLDPGPQTISINVDHLAAVDGNSDSVIDEFELFTQRRLSAVVDIVAAGETQAEITVPEMHGEIRITGRPLSMAMVHMPLDQSLSYEDSSPFVYETPADEATFAQVPAGTAQVMVSRLLPEGAFPDSPGGFRNVWEHHWADVSSEPAVIELDDLEAGRLRVTLHSAEGVPIQHFLLKAGPAHGDLPADVRSAWTPEQIQSTGVYVEDGVGILYVAPGRYDAIITIQDETIVREVEIDADETVELELSRGTD